MPVFKLCLKIIRKNLTAIIMYMVIFLLITIMITSVINSEQEKITSFDRIKADISFISEEDTELVRGLKHELSKVASFKELRNEKDALQDALFFRDVRSIVRIERGFTERFMNGEDVSVGITNIPDSYSSIYIGMAVEQYLNTARLYLGGDEPLSQEELVRNVADDLGVSTPVRILDRERNSVGLSATVYYFNYLAYSLLAILIFGIGTIMVVFKKPDTRMRNYCSPFSVLRINIEIILGLFVFTLVTWIVMVSFHFVLNRGNAINKSTLYFLLNSSVFTFAATGLSFLIGTVMKTRDAISALSNVVTLGMSFISGVFVPQQLLSDSVLKIASVMPTYWYVRANTEIGSLRTFNANTLESVYSSLLIQIGFGVLFFAAALLFSKRKRV